MELRDLITSHGVRALQGHSRRSEARRALTLSQGLQQDVPAGLVLLLTRLRLQVLAELVPNEYSPASRS